ncbi:MAG: imidazoleglycerol-phosphate dehydratase HisB [Myxococcota bacterium]
MPRRVKVHRKTSETEVEIALDLDGTGKRHIETPLPFFSHMLDAFARHGLFDLDVRASGDVDVDGHHTVEDVGLCLGQAFREALGEKQGIARYGQASIPFDDTLVDAVVDFGGRPAFVWLVDGLERRWIGTFDCELVHEFWQSFVTRAECNLHVRRHYGENAHHIVEAGFKAVARAALAASRVEPRSSGVPSTKGTLTE